MGRAREKFFASICICVGGAIPASANVDASTSMHGFSTDIVSALSFSSTVGALFPLVGLIAAILATQLLRRRKIAQLRSSSTTGD
jgi:hypothetical protein